MNLKPWREIAVPHPDVVNRPSERLYYLNSSGDKIEQAASEAGIVGSQTQLDF